MKAFLKLLPNLRPYRWQMGIVILSAPGVTAMSLVTPWLIRELIHIIRTADSNDDGRALGWLVGTGPGAGFALLFFLSGLGMVFAGILGFCLPQVHHVEEIVPEHIPL